MRTLIVTGLSGAGKSKAVDILEDVGYFCVDNVPARLVRTFVDLCYSAESEINLLAVVTDIRGEIFSNSYQQDLSELRDNNKDVEILFLEADKETLVRRYQESRRKHPLTARAGSLSSSIDMEIEMLSGLRKTADHIINTTRMSNGELRQTILNLISAEKNNMTIQVNVSSFGFKYGMPVSADFVFDVRFLPNPFYKKELRTLTGEDKEVQDYVMSFPESEAYFKKIVDMMETTIPLYRDVNKEHVEVAFGCTGGQHRSVTFAVLFEKAFKERGYVTRIAHRDIKKDREA